MLSLTYFIKGDIKENKKINWLTLNHKRNLDMDILDVFFKELRTRYKLSGTFYRRKNYLTEEKYSFTPRRYFRFWNYCYIAKCT